MAVLFGAGVGYWVDWRWDTTPYGVIAGLVIGFAAMVLRLLRLGRELVPGTEAGARPETNARSSAGLGAGPGDGPEGDRGPAESPALSDVWSDDATDDWESNKRD